MAAGGLGAITPDFIIYTYDNVEMIWRVLNGVAMIFTSGGGQFDFKALLKLLGMVGFLVALTSMLFKPGSMGGPAWFGSFILVYTVLMVPVSNVAVINKGVKPGASVNAMTVSNVPVFLAFVGSVTSTIGTKLTDAFDTVFSGVGLQGGGSNPISSYNKYADTGVGFAHQAILKAQEANFNQPDIQADIQQFVLNCSAFDVGDTYSAAALAKVTATTSLVPMSPAPSPAPNKSGPGLWNALSFTNPAHVTTYTHAQSGAEVFENCGDAWRAIDAKIQTAGDELLKKYYLFMSGDPQGGGSSAQQAYKSALAMAQIGTASMTVKDMLLHTATVNAVRKGFVTASGDGSSGGMLLALADAQAVASTNSSYIVQAKLAEQALPMIRNSIEAILYAIFPIVCFLCLILTGSALATALKGYVLSFIWIQLWAPIYSIINYLGQVKLGRTLVETARHSDGTGGIGINMENFDHIYAGVVSDQAIVGWLLPLVPVIASAIIHGMNQAMGQLGGGSFVAQAGRAAEAAGSGNVQLGNVSAGQQNLGPTVNSAFKSTFSDAYGTTTSNIGSGGTQAISGNYLEGFKSEKTTVGNGTVSANSASQGGPAENSNTIGSGVNKYDVINQSGSSEQGVNDASGKRVTSVSSNANTDVNASNGNKTTMITDQAGNIVAGTVDSGIKKDEINEKGRHQSDLTNQGVKIGGKSSSGVLHDDQFIENGVAKHRTYNETADGQKSEARLTWNDKNGEHIEAQAWDPNAKNGDGSLGAWKTVNATSTSGIKHDDQVIENGVAKHRTYSETADGQKSEAKLTWTDEKGGEHIEAQAWDPNAKNGDGSLGAWKTVNATATSGKSEVVKGQVTINQSNDGVHTSYNYDQDNLPVKMALTHQDLESFGTAASNAVNSKVSTVNQYAKTAETALKEDIKHGFMTAYGASWEGKSSKEKNKLVNDKYDEIVKTNQQQDESVSLGLSMSGTGAAYKTSGGLIHSEAKDIAVTKGDAFKTGNTFTSKDATGKDVTVSISNTTSESFKQVRTEAAQLDKVVAFSESINKLSSTSNTESIDLTSATFHAAVENGLIDPKKINSTDVGAMATAMRSELPQVLAAMGAKAPEPVTREQMPDVPNSTKAVEDLGREKIDANQRAGSKGYNQAHNTQTAKGATLVARQDSSGGPTLTKPDGTKSNSKTIEEKGGNLTKEVNVMTNAANPELRENTLINNKITRTLTGSPTNEHMNVKLENFRDPVFYDPNYKNGDNSQKTTDPAPSEKVPPPTKNKQ